MGLGLAFVSPLAMAQTKHFMRRRLFCLSTVMKIRMRATCILPYPPTIWFVTNTYVSTRMAHANFTLFSIMRNFGNFVSQSLSIGRRNILFVLAG